MRCLVLAFVFFFSSSASALLSPRDHQPLIEASVRLTLEQQYDSAMGLLKDASQKEPNNPLFNFYLLLTTEAMMVDYETTAWEKSFDSLARKTEAGFKAAQKREPQNPWIPYFLGSLYVTRGAHELRFSHYLNFTKSILNGVNLLKKSVKMDSTLCDAYLYIGLFQFARSKLVGWIPTFEDERETAISLIEKAGNESLFSRDFAAQVLTGLYGHTGELDKAAESAGRFKAKYPRNRAIYWIMGNAYLSQKRYPEAEKEFLALKPLIEQGIPPIYAYNYGTIDVLLADIAFKTGRYEESLKLCQKVGAMQSKDKRIGEVKDMARKLALKCGKKLKNGKGA